MRVSTMTSLGLKITYNPMHQPLTSGLKNLINGKQIVKFVEENPLPSKTAKKITLTRGETSPQNSAKKRFETPLKHGTENSRDCGRFCKWNGGRKAKTFSRVTIRGAAFIN